MASETMTPPTVTGVTPYINVQGASEASAFYQKAFGAKELMRMPAEDGKRLMHCHLEINDGPLLMSDCWPEGRPPAPALQLLHHAPAGRRHRRLVEARDQRRRDPGDAGGRHVLG